MRWVWQNTIKDKNRTSNQDRAKAMIFRCHHLDEGLKWKYLTVENPPFDQDLTAKNHFEPQNNLKDRYDHMKIVIIPLARYEWIH